MSVKTLLDHKSKLLMLLCLCSVETCCRHVGWHHGSTVQDDNNNIFVEDNEPMNSLVVLKVKFLGFMLCNYLYT